MESENRSSDANGANPVRITTDDYARYPMPMLTCPELEIVVRKRMWDEYAIDESNGRTSASRQRVVRL